MSHKQLEQVSIILEAISFFLVTIDLYGRERLRKLEIALKKHDNFKRFISKIQHRFIFTNKKEFVWIDLSTIYFVLGTLLIFVYGFGDLYSIHFIIAIFFLCTIPLYLYIMWLFNGVLFSKGDRLGFWVTIGMSLLFYMFAFFQFTLLLIYPILLLSYWWIRLINLLFRYNKLEGIFIMAGSLLFVISKCTAFILTID